jgi:hypothetical protein
MLPAGIRVGMESMSDRGQVIQVLVATVCAATSGAGRSTRKHKRRSPCRAAFVAVQCQGNESARVLSTAGQTEVAE